MSFALRPLAAWVLALAPALSHAGTGMPAALDPAGSQLRLASCGVRQVLWMRLYSVGLYLPPGAPLDAALDAKRPAALRIEILDKGDFPPRIPQKWRGPLERGLSAQAMSRVRAAYGNLRDGDRLTLAYVPRQGVRLSVNGEALAHAHGHALIADMLRVWAGGDALAGKLRRIALRHPC